MMNGIRWLTWLPLALAASIVAGAAGTWFSPSLTGFLVGAALPGFLCGQSQNGIGTSPSWGAFPVALSLLNRASTGIQHRISTVPTMKICADPFGYRISIESPRNSEKSVKVVGSTTGENL